MDLVLKYYWLLIFFKSMKSTYIVRYVHIEVVTHSYINISYMIILCKKCIILSMRTSYYLLVCICFQKIYKNLFHGNCPHLNETLTL